MYNEIPELLLAFEMKRGWKGFLPIKYNPQFGFWASLSSAFGNKKWWLEAQWRFWWIKMRLFGFWPSKYCCKDHLHIHNSTTKSSLSSLSGFQPWQRQAAFSFDAIVLLQFLPERRDQKKRKKTTEFGRWWLNHNVNIIM